LNNLNLKTIPGYAKYGVLLSLYFSIVFINGCSSDSDDTTSTAKKVYPVDAVYANTVEPVFYRSCLSCHVNGGIAPFSLKREEEGYKNAVTFKFQIKNQLTAKLMPPFLATNDGSCKQFEHENAVSDLEVSAINEWVNSLTPDTAANVTDAPPSPRVKTTIANPDLVVEMPGTYSVSSNVSDDYRCFVIDAGLTSDKLLTSYEVLPGNPGIVHHVILFNVGNTADVTTAENLDNADPGLGYTCFGDSGISSQQVLAGWAPGTGATSYPQNTGVRLTAGSRLIFQVHYNTSNAAGNYEDRSKIKLKLAPINSLQEAYMVAHYVSGFQLTSTNNTVDQQLKLSDVIPGAATFPNVKVHGVFPHMHTYGQKISASKISAAGEECLVNVNDWNFEWQRYYSYDSQQPDVILDPRNDSVAIHCEYNIPATDAAGNPLVVNEGSNSSDEMCVNFYYVTPIL